MNKSILVVEDSPSQAEMVRADLERLGYRVDVAVNGREAVEAVARTPYAAVLMDCQMPEMDGYEATRRIRADLPGRRVPIIAMTASAMKDEQTHSRDAGMDDFLSKPFRTDELSRSFNAGPVATLATSSGERSPP